MAEIEIEAVGDAAGSRRHHDQPGAHEQRLFDAVGDEEDHLAGLAPDRQDQFLHLLAGERVERAQRFVHQQHRGIAGQRARDADALLHAARQLVDGRVLEALQPDQLRDILPRVCCARSPPMPCSRRPNATLSSTFSQGISACFWNTTPRSAPGPGDRPRRRAGSCPGRRQEAGDAVQQRGLAAARGAERDDEVAVVHGQVDVLKGLYRGRVWAEPESDVNVVDYEVGHGSHSVNVQSTPPIAAGDEASIGVRPEGAAISSRPAR